MAACTAVLIVACMQTRERTRVSVQYARIKLYACCKPKRIVDAPVHVSRKNLNMACSSTAPERRFHGIRT